MLKKVKKYEFRQKADLDLLSIYTQTGNQFAFNELYKRHIQKLKIIVNNYTKDINLTYDYIQEIWLIVLEKCKIQKGNFASWLFIMTKNYCVDKFRVAKRNQKKISKYDLFVTSKENDEETIEQIDYKERLNDLLDVFDCLSDLQKKVVYYRMLGVKYAKISELLQVSKGTLTPAFTMAIGKLRRKLAENNKIENQVSLSLRRYLNH